MTGCAVGYTPAPGEWHGVQLLLPATVPEYSPVICAWKTEAKEPVITKFCVALLWILPWLSAIEVESPEEKG